MIMSNGERMIFLSSIFILVNAGQGQECTELIKNKEYSCSGRNLTCIPGSLPFSVASLDFSFNFLTSLHKRVFPVMLNLQLLDLTRCYIRQIEKDAFYNVKNLMTLILTGNPITYLAPECLNSLYKLQRLVLVDVRLESLQLQINNLTKLQDLKVGTNCIQSMTLPSFMSTFKDFSLLDLHANNISIIRMDHTAVLREIGRNMTLILSRNPLIHIEPGAFKDVILRELHLLAAFISFNAQKECHKALTGLTVDKLFVGRYRMDEKIKVSVPDYLEGLCSINFNEIYLVQKEWSDSEMHLFRCMVNATKITIKKAYMNSMKHIPFHRLKELYLSDTGLSVVPFISHIPSLEKLVMKSPFPITFTGVSDLPLLQYVDLSGNMLILHECCSILFPRTPNIQYLNLSQNSEITFVNEPFSALDLLEVLDFHHTKLVIVFYFGFFKHLRNLKYLDISYTRVHFNTLTFQDLHNLTVLKMAGNSFSGDKLSYFLQNLTSLEVLDISQCGIEKVSMRSFTGTQKLRHLYLSRNKLMVLDFLTQPELTHLTSVYIDKNSITTIPLDVLQKLPMNLSEFDLSSNSIDCSCSQTDFILWIIQKQNILKQLENIRCKTFSANTDFKAIDFDIDYCVHKKRLTIVLSVICVTFVVVLAILLYKFWFYVQYCFILFSGYRSPGQQECSYDAFVIFSSYDEAWVMNELMENLENGVPPIQLCLHMRDFQAGKSIASNIIDEGIMGSRKIIVVVSQHFIDSSWCRFEFELAQSRFLMERNANIIIIILEDVAERKTKKVFGLHKHLKKNTYLKWSRDPLSNMRFWIRLRKAILQK
ncbi:toll-like receptor 4b, duplicate b precursor [Danio rerio]|uniref:Toll-like receptor 4 n=3 Tax=Cyprinoidei TaxID=30727 RepID=B8A691_DANRE|nr:toll-like receptor 4b, duplicate b precursor [Danio rerio]|eukprot:NP_997978.2 toll-like receptor 4b, duplicate b precursor [Danio rerio]